MFKNKKVLDRVMEDFEKVSDVGAELINKYKRKLPQDIIYIWENYGFGSFHNGYLKVINPEEYLELVDKTFFISGTIPMFLTGTGQIITWYKKDGICMLIYEEEDFDILDLDFEYFWEDLQEKEVTNLSEREQEYDKIVKHKGKPGYKECFVMDKNIPGDIMEVSEYVEKLTNIYGKIYMDD